MTPEEFKTTLTQQEPPPQWNAVQKALWYDANGNWDKAHDYAQQENDSASAWIHAYLHRKEGDTFNAQYWYTRAGRTMPETTLQQEWEEMVSVLTAR